MTVDNSEDKKLLLYVIKSFPVSGPYEQVLQALKPLQELEKKVQMAEIEEEKCI